MHTLQAFSSSKYRIFLQTYGLQTNNTERERERERESYFSTYKAKYCHYAHIYVNIKRTPRDPITQIMNQKQFIT